MIVGIWLVREYLQGGIIDKQLACSECDYTSGHVMSNWKYCPVCGSRLFISIGEMNKFVDKCHLCGKEVEVNNE